MADADSPSPALAVPNIALGASLTSASVAGSASVAPPITAQNFFAASAGGGGGAGGIGSDAGLHASTADGAGGSSTGAGAGGHKSVRDYLLKRVGFVPRDAFGWLYACRGLYQSREYALVIEGLSHCLRNEKTSKEAQHLLAFSLLHTRQSKAAAHAFYKSIAAGNQTDWQPLIELLLDHKSLHLTLPHQTGTATGGAASAAAAGGAGIGAGKHKKAFS